MKNGGLASVTDRHTAGTRWPRLIDTNKDLAARYCKKEVGYAVRYSRYRCIYIHL